MSETSSKNQERMARVVLSIRPNPQPIFIGGYGL